MSNKNAILGIKLALIEQLTMNGIKLTQGERIDFQSLETKRDLYNFFNNKLSQKRSVQ